MGLGLGLGLGSGLWLGLVLGLGKGYDETSAVEQSPPVPASQAQRPSVHVPCSEQSFGHLVRVGICVRVWARFGVGLAPSFWHHGTRTSQPSPLQPPSHRQPGRPPSTDDAMQTPRPEQLPMQRGAAHAGPSHSGGLRLGLSRAGVRIGLGSGLGIGLGLGLGSGSGLGLGLGLGLGSGSGLGLDSG